LGDELKNFPPGTTYDIWIHIVKSVLYKIDAKLKRQCLQKIKMILNFNGRFR